MMIEQNYGCNGPCQQGKQDCPHPDACFMPCREAGSAMRFLTAVVLAATAMGVGFLLAWLIP